MSSAICFSLDQSKILSSVSGLIDLVLNFKDFNSIPNDKILDWSKLKAFADNKVNVTKKLKFVLGTEQNIVGKEEIAGNQHFLLFPQCLQEAFLSGSLKVGTVW